MLDVPVDPLGVSVTDEPVLSPVTKASALSGEPAKVLNRETSLLASVELAPVDVTAAFVSAAKDVPPAVPKARFAAARRASVKIFGFTISLQMNDKKFSLLHCKYTN